MTDIVVIHHFLSDDYFFLLFFFRQLFVTRRVYPDIVNYYFMFCFSRKTVSFFYLNCSFVGAMKDWWDIMNEKKRNKSEHTQTDRKRRADPSFSIKDPSVNNRRSNTASTPIRKGQRKDFFFLLLNAKGRR